MSNDNLGDRMKRYEKAFKPLAVRRMPLLVRADGKAFHTLCCRMEKPFDDAFITSMRKAALLVANKMQGFKVAYVQSDEVTFCMTDYDTVNTDAWFGYEINKVVSITAAMMSVAFNDSIARYAKADVATIVGMMLPVFDARAFNVPREDVVNAFLWRAQDWHRNSIQMYARSFFSQKQLHNKKIQDIHEMLHSIGKNWAMGLSPTEKNGTFIIRNEAGVSMRSDIEPKYKAIHNVVWPLLQEKEEEE